MRRREIELLRRSLLVHWKHNNTVVCVTLQYMLSPPKHQDRDFPSANNKRIQNCKEENSLRLTLGRMSKEEKLVILCAGFIVMSVGRMRCQERPES